MRVIIAGGRDFNDYEQLKTKCNHILQNQTDIEILCGCANGADKLGEKFALESYYKIKYFPADWNNKGKSAGYQRNIQMAEYADALIAFWNGNSRGTKHMIDRTNKNGLKVRIIKY